MSKKILYIKFKSFDDFKKEVTEAVKERKKLIQKTDEVFFESAEAFRKFMTIQKVEILCAIISNSPESIYSLAHILSRDVAAVQRDCTALKNVGFIILEEKNDNRGSKQPKLKFSYEEIIVESNYSYSINLVSKSKKFLNVG
jgi:predicted transcriptional regulator